MTFSITIGWWLLPLALTLVALTWALWERQSSTGGFFPDLMPLVRLAGALIAALVIWVIYLSIRLAVLSW